MAPANSEYVCLSYVWGFATEAREIMIESTGGFPQTVVDAMQFTVQTGYRYLWVDRHCINQDDPKEKDYLISKMDLIYGGAALTIVAASGNSSHTGLPGVGSTPRPVPKSFIFNTQRYATITSPRNEVAFSKWNSRGWTYQEGVLSHRRLIFTDTQAFFQCDLSQCVESLEPSYTNALFGSANSIFTTNSSDDDFVCFMLGPYFRRQLSYEADTIKAFLDILQSTMKSRPDYRAAHLYGVPIPFGEGKEPSTCTTWFLRNLTWRVDWIYKEDRRTRKVCGFPSWSWASLKANLSPPITGDITFDQTPVVHGEGSRHTTDVDVYCFDSQYQRYSISESTTLATTFAPLIEISTWVAEVPAVIPLGGKTKKPSQDYALEAFRLGDSKLVNLWIDYPQDASTARPHAVFLWSYNDHRDKSPQATFMLVEPTKAADQVDTYQRIGLFHATYNDCKGNDFESIANSITPNCVIGIKRDVHGMFEEVSSREGAEGMIKWQRRTLRLV
ncbi:hypothetical protein E8E11_007061 [Didymella keratinophila]|nr:hypothetical protein E8E11_007061 [Didymella keratinophila]